MVIAGLRQQFEADLRLTLPFGASVLVPGLDLRVGESQRSGQVHSVLDAEILLPFEASLQLLELVVGEGGSGFAGLFGFGGAVLGGRGAVGGGVVFFVVFFIDGGVGG